MKLKIIAVFLILLAVIATSHCGPAVVIINDPFDDSVEAQVEDGAADESPAIIFPMLDMLGDPKKQGAVKVVSKANTGLRKPFSGHRYFDLPLSPRYKNPAESSQFTIENANVGPEYQSNTIDAMVQSPPPYNETARMARYIVANSNWTSLSTVSTRQPTIGFPFSNIASISDGPVGKSTGVPYFYLTPLDLSVIDLQVSNKASISMTLAQGDYCRLKNYDTEDPRCARVILTGRIFKIPVGSSEEIAAKAALFSRHTGMSDWPKDHGFFCAKLRVSNILLLDYFGGAKVIPVDEYFTTDPY